MPLPLRIDHDGRQIGPRDVAAAVGISHAQACERIRKGLRGAALFAPKADQREAARRNPDPFGWSWRRANGK